MGGIYLYLQYSNEEGISRDAVANALKLEHRGGCKSQIEYFDTGVLLALHATRHESIMEYNGMYCVMDGELWGDQEILLIFERVGRDPKSLCQELDGEYSYIIYDPDNNRIFTGTDELSTRPLFWSFDEDGFGIASESKALDGVVTRLPPGSTVEVGMERPIVMNTVQYYDFEKKILDRSRRGVEEEIRTLLTESVRKKSSMVNPIGCLLSGGLDSSLIAALLSRIHSDPIHTFSIGIVDSDELPPDILAAREVSSKIKSIHHEVLYTMEEAFQRIPDIIRSIESWDQTTIRASTLMDLGLEYISQNTPEVRVIFSGEVSDELFAGYLYTYRSPSPEETRRDTIRLLSEIHTFDGLRADRIVSRWGRELRLPFFDKELIDSVLSSPTEYFDTAKNGCEKRILREAFAQEDLLPEEILWRTKEALSDGTSHKSGWREYIKSRLDISEDAWYLKIFDKLYDCRDLIPHKWMPRWSPEVGDDSSAASLKF